MSNNTEIGLREVSFCRSFLYDLKQSNKRPFPSKASNPKVKTKLTPTFFSLLSTSKSNKLTVKLLKPVKNYQNQYTLDFMPGDTVYELKKKLEFDFEFKLVFKGKSLVDEKVLGDYGICSGDLIHCMPVKVASVTEAKNEQEEKFDNAPAVVETKKEEKQGLTQKEELSDEFWNDLKAFLQGKIKNQEKALKVFAAFKSQYTKGGEITTTMDLD